MSNLRLTLAAVGISMLLTACGSGPDTATDSSPREPSTTVTGSPSAEAELEGSWLTSPVSQSDAEATLRQHGLGKWIERFRVLLPFASGAVLILQLHEGEWDLYGKSEGEPRSEIDYNAEYSVEGDKVVVAHADGARTLRWSVDGDTLTLESLKTTLAPYKGIPDEVFQVALHMTEDFERQS
jgi:hypothetical protein